LNLDASTGTGIDVLAANNSQAFTLRLLDGDLERNVNMSSTGSAAFNLLVDNNDINTTGTDVAFALTFSGAATSNVTFRNGNVFAAADASALSLTTSSATAKTTTFLVQDSVFTSTSATANAVTFLSSGNTLMNATIQGNTFDNSGGGQDFAMESNGAQA